MLTLPEAYWKLGVPPKDTILFLLVAKLNWVFQRKLSFISGVALDKACADLVIQAPVLHSDNVLAKKHEHEDLCGCDKFHMIHPDTDWLAGLRHAEKIGLGTMDYELIKI